MPVNTALNTLSAIVAARAHYWFMFSLPPSGPPGRAAPLPVYPQPMVLQGALASKGQDFAPVLVEFHQVSVGSFLQPVQVPLNGTLALRSISSSTGGRI